MQFIHGHKNPFLKHILILVTVIVITLYLLQRYAPEWTDLPNRIRAGFHSRCTLQTCFDASRCHRLRDEGILTVMIYDLPKQSATQQQLQYYAHTSAFYTAVLTHVQQHYEIVHQPQQACIMLPRFDISCHGNTCFEPDVDNAAAIRLSPLWNHGLNHVIFDVSDWCWRHWFSGIAPFDTDQAMVIKTTPNARWYRHGFDVSIPLTDVQRHPYYNHSKEVCKPIPMDDDITQRDVLVFFKGAITNDIRTEIITLHNPAHGVITVHSSDKEFDFQSTLKRSKFGLAPAGLGLHSYRLFEVMEKGVIPVSIAKDDNFVFPFDDILDWNEFSVIVPYKDLKRIPDILRSIPPERLRRMRRRLAEVWDRYFCSTPTFLNVAFDQIQNRILRISPSG